MKKAGTRITLAPTKLNAFSSFTLYTFPQFPQPRQLHGINYGTILSCGSANFPNYLVIGTSMLSSNSLQSRLSRLTDAPVSSNPRMCSPLILIYANGLGSFAWLCTTAAAISLRRCRKRNLAFCILRDTSCMPASWCSPNILFLASIYQRILSSSGIIFLKSLFMSLLIISLFKITGCLTSLLGC